MSDINFALACGMPVVAHRRETDDGHAVCVFVCGHEPTTDTTWEMRYVEVILCGAGEQGTAVRLLGLPFDAFALLDGADLYTARELVERALQLAHLPPRRLRRRKQQQGEPK